jgi:hypothetical protein
MRRNITAVVLCGLAGCALAGVLIALGGPAEPQAAVVQVHRSATASRVADARRLDCKLQRRRFRTLPDVRPTPFCVAVRRGAKVGREGILVTPRPDPKRDPHEQFGLMLISNDGKLLWYMRRPHKVHDLKPVSYHGRPALAFFERDSSGGYYELLDQQYRSVARIRAGYGDPTDEHELQLTSQGMAYVGSDPVKRGNITDYVVREIDPASGSARFEWRARGNIALADSYAARPHDGTPWDYFHGNSIDSPTASDPTVIVSARNTSAVYGIDRRTGKTKWILGGKRDQFHLARHPNWVFCTQHDVRRLPGNRLLMFDNGGAHIARSPRCPVHPARVLLFKLDPARHRVRLLRSISSVGLAPSGGGFLSGWVGSAVPQSGGDVLVDWGSVPRVSSIGPDGREKLVLRLRYWSYRAAPSRWVGRPGGVPAMAVKRGDGHVTIWASWNGATEIERWQVLAGKDANALAPVGSAPFEDLETRIRVHTDEPCVAVRALDAHGAVLGAARATKVG